MLSGFFNIYIFASSSHQTPIASHQVLTVQWYKRQCALSSTCTFVQKSWQTVNFEVKLSDVEMAEVEPEQTMPVKKEVVDESALDVSTGGTQLKRPTHFRNSQFLLEMYELKISEGYTYLHPNITDYIRLHSDAK